jgi:hypothetical protein
MYACFSSHHSPCVRPGRTTAPYMNALLPNVAFQMLLLLISKLVLFIDITASYSFTFPETFLHLKDDWHCLGAFKAGNVFLSFFSLLSPSVSLTVWERTTHYVNPWWRRERDPEMSDISCTPTRPVAWEDIVATKAWNHVWSLLLSKSSAKILARAVPCAFATIKLYRDVDVKLQAFIALELDKCQWSRAFPTPRHTGQEARWTPGPIELRAKEKNS